MVTLNDQLICAADHQEGLLSHMVHILKVNLSSTVRTSHYSVNWSPKYQLSVWFVVYLSSFIDQVSLTLTWHISRWFSPEVCLMLRWAGHLLSVKCVLLKWVEPQVNLMPGYYCGKTESAFILSTDTHNRSFRWNWARSFVMVTYFFSPGAQDTPQNWGLVCFTLAPSGERC